MKTLLIDTSRQYLAVGLVINDKLVDNQEFLANKKQSELLIKTIDTVLFENNLKPLDIEAIVVTNGPGSYTGMRIALTFTKTYALAKPNVEIYTINTLLSLTGLKSGFAFIDARSNRTFGAFIANGEVSNERVYQLEEVADLKESNTLFGDLELLGMDSAEPNICQNILEAKSAWELVENADLLVPNYLK